MVVEAAQPAELLPHVAEQLFAHVREDGRLETGILYGVHPAQHRLVERAPHQHVILDQPLDLGGAKLEAGIVGDLLPESASIQVAQIVGMAVAPVVAVKRRSIEPGDGVERGESRRFLRRA